ncbi:MAG: dihydropteroate synthase [Bacteroidota bacterium]
MTIQLVDIFYPNVFRRYSAKYNIFRELYEKDLVGIEIRGIEFRLAQNIKRIILTNKEICYTTGKKGDLLCDLLVIGTYGIFRELSKEIISIGNEDLGRKVARIIQNITDYENRSMQIGKNNFSLDRAYTVGILNVTPDSFSDGGKYFQKKNAVEHGLKLLEQGADILDIGGESTRPGADAISEEEEIKRVIPVIEEIIKVKPESLISIDTSKSKVAYEALQCGAKIVNDISSFTLDPKILDVVKQFNAALILMHMKETPKTMQSSLYYEDVVSEIYDYLTSKVDAAKKIGIKNIIVDPGIGFGKRVMDNYELIKRLNEFKGIGQPILVGLSRKSFIGKALELNIEERDEPTLSAETLAIKNGARFIRTHEVKKTIYASKINRFLDNPELLQNV